MALDTLMLPDLALPDTDGITRQLSEFTISGPAVVVYARGAYCPFCMRQLADYADHYGAFKQSGLEVVALNPESQRQSRRLRTGLKLPFTVLADSRFEVAKNLGLMNHEHPGLPTPATLMVDPHRRVVLSTLNEGTKSLLARDMLEYGRALKVETPAAPPPSSPQVQAQKPGAPLFLRALVNMALARVAG